MRLLSLLILLLLACQKSNNATETTQPRREVRTIAFNNIRVDVVLERPTATAADVLLLYHGTVLLDSRILDAAHTTLDQFKAILDRKDMLLISVAYPEENLLIGDNMAQSEAALLWVKNNAARDLGITIKKIFLAGHSQGGYLVTRLNTLHATNGVIANAPGPLNLVYRCQSEELGQIPAGTACTQLRNTYGTTTANPGAYFQRSLRNFIGGYKADILFVQGLSDAAVQMYSWPTFKQEVANCTDCKERLFEEVPGGGHTALFNNPAAKAAFNSFINSR